MKENPLSKLPLLINNTVPTDPRYVPHAPSEVHFHYNTDPTNSDFLVTYTITLITNDRKNLLPHYVIVMTHHSDIVPAMAELVSTVELAIGSGVSVIYAERGPIIGHSYPIIKYGNKPEKITATLVAVNGMSGLFLYSAYSGSVGVLKKRFPPYRDSRFAKTYTPDKVPRIWHDQIAANGFDALYVKVMKLDML